MEFFMKKFRLLSFLTHICFTFNRRTNFRKLFVFSSSFLSLGILLPILSGCSSKTDFSGTYYFYDNEGFDKTSSIVLNNNTWTDSNGDSGDVEFTVEKATSAQRIKLYKGEDALYSGWVSPSGSMFFSDYYGVDTYYCKEDADFEKINQRLPHKVTNKDDFLALFANPVNPKINQLITCYDIMNDIDLEGLEIYPNATKPTQYKIYVNGRGHTIKNYKAVSGTYSGLFPSLIRSEIKNLTLADAEIAGERSGALTGSMEDTLVQNVKTTSTVKVGDVNKTFAGGIVGFATDNSYLDNCENEASIRGASSTGGVVGKSYNSNITHCTNKGDIYTLDSSNCGGVVGFYHQYWESYETHSETFDSNTNFGHISSEFSNNVGGIAGRIMREKPSIRFVDDSSPLPISNCFNYGTIYGNNNTGGIVGVEESSDGIEKAVSFTSCSNYGVVHGNLHVGGITGYGKAITPYSKCTNEPFDSKDNLVSGGYFVGGITGYGNIFNDCENKGVVELSKNNEGSSDYYDRMFIGGITGCTYNGTKPNFTNCKNSGIIRGYLEDPEQSGSNKYRGHFVGGICGSASGGDFNNCESTGSVFGGDSVGGLAGKLYPKYETKIKGCKVQGSIKISVSTGGGFIGALNYTNIAAKDSTTTHYSSNFTLSNCQISECEVEINGSIKFGYCVGRAFSNSKSSDQYGKATVNTCDISLDVSSNKLMDINAVCDNSEYKGSKVLTVDLDEEKVHVNFIVR